MCHDVIPGESLQLQTHVQCVCHTERLACRGRVRIALSNFRWFFYFVHHVCTHDGSRRKSTFDRTLFRPLSLSLHAHNEQYWPGLPYRARAVCRTRFLVWNSQSVGYHAEGVNRRRQWQRKANQTAHVFPLSVQVIQRTHFLLLSFATFRTKLICDVGELNPR